MHKNLSSWAAVLKLNSTCELSVEESIKTEFTYSMNINLNPKCLTSPAIVILWTFQVLIKFVAGGTGRIQTNGMVP